MKEGNETARAFVRGTFRIMFAFGRFLLLVIVIVNIVCNHKVSHVHIVFTATNKGCGVKKNK